MRVLGTFTPIIAIAVLAAAGCGGSGGSDDSSTDGEFASMLDAVPAELITADGALLQYVDMDLVWDRLGLAEAPEAERLAALADTTEVETYSLMPRLFDVRASLVDEARSEIGFSMFDVTREIAVENAPLSLQIDEISASRSDVDDALRSDPIWSDLLVEVDSEHGTYYDWNDGDDAALDLERMSTIRPLGIGGQVSLIGDDDVTFVRTTTSDLMESTLTVMDGDGASATDDAAMSAAIDAIGDDDVVQLVAVHEPTMAGDAGQAGAPQGEANALFVNTYDALVIAELRSGADVRTEILVVHEDDGAATANVEPIETQIADALAFSGQPIREILPGATVTQDGPVVRITMTEPGTFRRSFDALMRRDLMIAG